MVSHTPLQMMQSECFILVYRCMQNDNDDIIKTSDTVLLEKYTSHFIWKGCVWEGVGDRTELQHIDPHSYGHQRFFPVLLCCSTGGPGAQLSAECCFLNSIISPSLWSPNSLNFLWTELYNSSTPTQSPHNWQLEYALRPSMEWHVWSSSSRNNCHEVHRSLPSGASVFDCTVGF